MKIVHPIEYRSGNRVLFLWDNIPYTGIVKTSTVSSYVIKPDYSKYITDPTYMPRLFDEIYIPKENCFHTGEIDMSELSDAYFSYILQKWHAIMPEYNNLVQAYDTLPKRTIVGNRVKDSFAFNVYPTVEFIHNRSVFRINGIYYIYTKLDNRISVLESQFGDERLYPMWATHPNYDKDEVVLDYLTRHNCKIINEFNIDEAYEVYTFDTSIPLWKSFFDGYNNLLYTKYPELHRPLIDVSLSYKKIERFKDSKKYKDDGINKTITYDNVKNINSVTIYSDIY